MAKNKNMKQDLKSVIMDSFQEHIDKKSVKDDKGGYGLIYSYNQKSQLLDISVNLSNWVKEEKGVNRLKDLTHEHVEGFLRAKSESCSPKTLEVYKSCLKKIGECVDVKRGYKIDWIVEGVHSARDPITKRGAQDRMSTDDLRTLTRYCIDNPSKSAVAVIIGSVTGMRVNDICRGVKIAQDGRIEATGKGGRQYRDKQLPEGAMVIIKAEKFSKYVEKLEDGSYLFKASGASVEKYLQRTEEKLGIEKHSFHSVRRACAQKHYDGCIAQGMSKAEALASTSEYLNHNGNRKDVESFLSRHYITL